jgi:hypothetical protein
MSRTRQVAPVLTLLFASPLIIEFLSGSTTLSSPWALLGFATLNGAGAVLIREAWVRRSGGQGGAVVMVALAVAYGLWEEGLLDQSLFNPEAYGGNWLSFGWVPALGTSVPVGIYEIAITALGSVLVPIGLVELTFPTRQGRPWLGTAGMGVIATVFLVLGSGSALAATIWITRGVADPRQLATTGAVVATLIALAVAWPTRGSTAHPRRVVSTTPSHGPTPRTWLVLASSLFATGAGIEIIHDDHRGWWPPAAATAILTALLVVAGLVVTHRHRTPGWSTTHQLALLAGPVLAIAALGLDLRSTDTPVHLTEQIVLTLAALAALITLAVRLRRRRNTSASAEQQALHE